MSNGLGNCGGNEYRGGADDGGLGLVLFIGTVVFIVVIIVDAAIKGMP